MPDDARVAGIDAIFVGGPRPRLDGPVHLADPDPGWAVAAAEVGTRIRAALGVRALALEHVGSTSVPGLPAKPILDMLLLVADAADEDAYVPALEAAGFELRIREVDWHGHRMLRGSRPAVNLHVFPAGTPEPGRMLAFRDRLRAHPEELDDYAAAKRDLAGRTWAYVQDYADAKSGVVERIVARGVADGAAADREALAVAIEQARVGRTEGGVPIGAALIADGRVLGAGHNRRIQLGSAIRHGETDALEVAGRLPAAVYRRATMATTLSPCDMCTGAILLYGIRRVVIGEHRTFLGGEDLLRSRGVEIVVIDSAECRDLMRAFIAERPDVWNEDIGED
jgi:creatinine deaminase